MATRMVVSPGAVKVAKPGYDADTAGLADLALSLAARQSQVVMSGFKTPDSTVYTGTGRIYTYSATILFSRLPDNADAIVQPAIADMNYSTTDVPIAGSAHVCGVGPRLVVFSGRPLNPYFPCFDLVNPGPMLIDFSTTSLIVATNYSCISTNPAEFAGFRYLILRKPLAG